MTLTNLSAHTQYFFHSSAFIFLVTISPLLPRALIDSYKGFFLTESFLGYNFPTIPAQELQALEAVV